MKKNMIRSYFLYLFSVKTQNCFKELESVSKLHSDMSKKDDLIFQSICSIYNYATKFEKKFEDLKPIIEEITEIIEKSITHTQKKPLESFMKKEYLQKIENLLLTLKPLNNFDNTDSTFALRQITFFLDRILCILSDSIFHFTPSSKKEFSNRLICIKHIFNYFKQNFLDFYPIINKLQSNHFESNVCRDFLSFRWYISKNLLLFNPLNINMKNIFDLTSNLYIHVFTPNLMKLLSTLEHELAWKEAIINMKFFCENSTHEAISEYFIWEFKIEVVIERAFFKLGCIDACGLAWREYFNKEKEKIFLKY